MDCLGETKHMLDMDGKAAGSAFFDLCPPPSRPNEDKVEYLVERLFSEDHLRFILRDHALFYQFLVFVNTFKPQYAATLVRYLEMQKAMNAVEYANAIASQIRWPSHKDHYRYSHLPAATEEAHFLDYAKKELKVLCTEVLPAFITNTLVTLVAECVARDITGQAIPAMMNGVGTVADVFCLTDPSQPDNPMIYASEEFHRTTQYGTSYAIDRNCRFLQGPGTDKYCKERLSRAITRGEQVCETILNYRRDGSPFVNLLMCAPLFDDKGTVRYFIGAQVDITGLIIDGRGIDSFRAFLRSEVEPRVSTDAVSSDPETQYPGIFPGGDPFDHPLRQKNSAGSSKRALKLDPLEKLRDLSLLFSQEEADMVSRNSRANGVTERLYTGAPSTPATTVDGYSLFDGYRDGSNTQIKVRKAIETNLPNGRIDISALNLYNTLPPPGLPGVYKHYLLTQPYPSLRILFVSPSLRLPGLLRSPLFSKLDGPPSALSSLSEAFRKGSSITAKVNWQLKTSRNSSKSDGEKNRQRWLRCTPLLSSDDRVGVWMIIVVPLEGNSMKDEDESNASLYTSSQASATSPPSQRTGSHSIDSTSERESTSGIDLGIRNTGRLRIFTQLEKGNAMDNDMYADYLRTSQVEQGVTIKEALSHPSPRLSSRGTKYGNTVS